MPSYKDEKTGKWYCKFYYRDWTGENKAKKKMGFSKKRDSQEWERDFLDKQQSNPDMTVGSMVELYMEDMRHRLRETTIKNNKSIIDIKILPFFKNRPISSITPSEVRKWQSQMLSYKDSSGKSYSNTYLKSMNDQFSSIFNYAVKYYNLRENPFRKAGSIGKRKANTMQFWTLNEYKQFYAQLSDQTHRLVFNLLYYTGVRVGELLAITIGDIDLESKTIHISKSFARINKTSIISDPKTPKSKRDILIPDFLCLEIKEYISRVYDASPDSRIISYVSKAAVKYILDTTYEKAGVKRIRVHDIRHSHASLLIELGFSPLLIAERLGHENVQTTLDTYSHLYPNKQNEVANALEALHVK